MKKRLFCLVSAFILILGIYSSAIEPVTLDYNYSASVTSGVIRYVSQIRSSSTYQQDYWGRFSPWAHNECGTASISMALSAIGINKTPLDLGEYWISKGYTWGVPFSTVLNDVPLATGGETYDFFGSFKRYIEGDGSYSPVVIYFTAATNPNRTGNRHFVVVYEQNEDGSFNAANPSKNEILNLKIEKTQGGSLYVTVYGHKGTTSGYISEYDFRSAQYHNPNFVPAPATEDIAEEVTEETLPAQEMPTEDVSAEILPAEEAPLSETTPEFMFPASLNPECPTAIPHNLCEIKFKDTGSDTYTIYYRRATLPGAGAKFNDDHSSALTFTIEDGLIARNGDGTISIFISETLESGYLYRFFVSDANGVSSKLVTYGIAK